MSKEKGAVFGHDDGGVPWVSKLQNYMVRKSVQRHLPRHLDPGTAHLMDVGCGYGARVLRQLYNDIALGVGLDFKVSDTYKTDPKLSFYEGDLYATMPELESESFDLVIFLSLLEHLDAPVTVLSHARRLLKPNGRIFFCCPNWFGKWVLEHIIFNFFDPHGAIEKQVDTHKMYYNQRDMWPLLVKAGFVSSEIKIWRSNFFCSISGYAEKTIY
jgi:SAM-dependent methyltransferase